MFADKLVGQPVVQPVARNAEDFDVLLVQADFFLEFAEHGCFRIFTAQDAALRELPATGADATAKH